MDKNVMNKVDELLNGEETDVMLRIRDMFEENLDNLPDDLTDYEFAKSEDEKKDALAHIYRDLAYMDLIKALIVKKYGLNHNVHRAFISKALNMELDKAS